EQRIALSIYPIVRDSTAMNYNLSRKKLIETKENHKELCLLGFFDVDHEQSFRHLMWVAGASRNKVNLI
ncbi:MAG: hypothetical protein Q4F13_10330, partial [Pseudomonadota bacterium]|nr:hypothetical protein [Pseudomonadota bacterium]